MKIRGGSPFANPGVQRNQQTKKTSKAGKKKGVKKSQKAEEVDAVEAVVAADPVEEVDSPFFEAMSEVSERLEGGDADMEEATRAVVSAVLEEHFGQKKMSKKDMDNLTQTVAQSFGQDNELNRRLERVLRKIAPSNRRKK